MTADKDGCIEVKIFFLVLNQIWDLNSNYQEVDQ